MSFAIGVYADTYPPYGGGTAVPQLTAPTVTKGTVTASTIPVSVAVDTHAVAYRFQLATDSGFTQGVQTSPNQTAGQQQTTVPYTFSGLAAGVLYYLRALKVGDGTTYRTSNYSATVQVTTAGQTTGNNQAFSYTFPFSLA